MSVCSIGKTVAYRHIEAGTKAERIGAATGTKNSEMLCSRGWGRHSYTLVNASRLTEVEEVVEVVVAVVEDKVVAAAVEAAAVEAAVEADPPLVPDGLLSRDM